MAHPLPPRYPELDQIAKRLAQFIVCMINIEARAVESKAVYKAQYILEALIEELQARV
jgi:hypothetical protein